MDYAVTSGAKDVREERVDEIYRLLRLYALKHQVQIRELGVDLEDFVQDVIGNIFRRKGLDKYDDTKCRSFEALVFNCAFRELVDKSRAKYSAKSRLRPDGSPFVLVSLDEKLPGDADDERTLADVLASGSDITAIAFEMLESVPDEQISGNYQLSWKSLFERSLELNPEEIANEIGISSSRIVQLQKELVRRFLSQP